MVYFLGSVVGGMIAIGFVALVIRGILGRLFHSAKDPLLVSCIIAVLIPIILPLFFGRPFDVESMVASILSGCFAFLILRRRFKREAEEAQEDAEEVVADVKEN